MKSTLPAALVAASLLLAPAAAHPGCGIVVDQDGNVCFVFGATNTVYRLHPDGELIVLAEGIHPDGTVRFRNPHHLVQDSHGNLYTADDGGRSVWRIAPDGTLKQHYPPERWYANAGVGFGGDPFWVDDDGGIYAVHSRQHEFTQILEILPDTRIRIFAEAEWGAADGPAGRGRIAGLHVSELLPDGDGGFYFTQAGASVRHLAADGTVRTLAGGDEWGFRDGRGPEARFHLAMGLARDGGGNLLVADALNHRIRRVAPDGTVTTVAGNGSAGDLDGPTPGESSFQDLTGVAVGQDGSIYALEHIRRDGHQGVRIRKITADGAVRTLATVLPEPESGG